MYFTLLKNFVLGTIVIDITKIKIRKLKKFIRLRKLFKTVLFNITYLITKVSKVFLKSFTLLQVLFSAI